MLKTLTSRCAQLFAVRSSRCHGARLNHLVTRSSHTDGISWLEDNLQVKVENKSENETYVEAVPVPSGREKSLIKAENGANKEACVLCRLNLTTLHYTDVLILSQFIKKNGSLVTYHESKLCSKQYLRIKRLIERAQRCNLIKRPFDYFVPGAWHDMNTYLERDRLRDQPMKVVKKEYWRI